MLIDGEENAIEMSVLGMSMLGHLLGHLLGSMLGYVRARERCVFLFVIW